MRAAATSVCNGQGPKRAPRPGNAAGAYLDFHQPVGRRSTALTAWAAVMARPSLLSNITAMFSPAAFPLGAITNNFGSKPNKIMPDGSYLSLALWDGAPLRRLSRSTGGAPEKSPALQLSNNARPMPQIGFARTVPRRSSWPVLDWLGPWQFPRILLRVLDGPADPVQCRLLRRAPPKVNPFDGLEIGLAKTEKQFCGRGHPCAAPCATYFINLDFSNHPDNVNGEGGDRHQVQPQALGCAGRAYVQMMNEGLFLVFPARGAALSRQRQHLRCRWPIIR